MRPRLLAFSLAALGAAGLLLLLGVPVAGQAKAGAATPGSGGVLNVSQREDTPQGFAIHESSTVSTTWRAMPCFNNLVLFDPLKQRESVETVIGELADKW